MPAETRWVTFVLFLVFMQPFLRESRSGRSALSRLAGGGEEGGGVAGGWVGGGCLVVSVCRVFWLGWG